MNNYRFYFCVTSMALTRESIPDWKTWVKSQNNIEMWADNDRLYLLSEMKNPNFKDAWFKYPEQSHMRIMYRHKDMWIFHKWYSIKQFERDCEFDDSIKSLNEESNIPEEGYDLQQALEDIEYELYCSGDKIEEEDMYCDEFVDYLFKDVYK